MNDDINGVGNIVVGGVSNVVMGDFGLAEVQGDGNGVEYEFPVDLGNDIVRILGDVRGEAVAVGGKKKEKQKKSM